MRGCEVKGGCGKREDECYLLSTRSPHLPLLDLVADDLPPLLDDLDQDVALLQELALLTGRVHLRTESQTGLDKQRY